MMRNRNSDLIVYFTMAGDVSKARLEISALQYHVESLKKQLDETGKAAAMDEDYR